VPQASLIGPAPASKPELPEALLRRMQAVVNAAHAQAVKEEEARREHATPPDQTSHPKESVPLPKRMPGAAGPSNPSNGLRPKLPTATQGGLPDEDAEFDTDPFLPRLTASGIVASPPTSKPGAQPNQSAETNGTAQPYDAVKPGQARRKDQALMRRDRRAAKRDRAVQARRAVQAKRERAAHAERERAEQEQAERERAAHAERERAAHAERERAEQEQAAQAERERAERERVERERAERERAEKERAAQAERAAEAERSAQAERERAERERAAQAERERAAEAAGAAQAVAKHAEQAQRAAPPNPAEPEQRTPPDGAEPDGSAEPDRVVPTVVDQPWRPLGLRKPPTRRRSRTIVLAVGVAALLAAGPLMLALLPHHGHRTPQPSAAERTINEAAAWVAQQVGPEDVVSCDLAMCLALEAHGVSVSDLLRMDPSARDLLTSQIIVSTAAIRNLFGSRLNSVYAPAVLASFGSGKARIDIRQIAPDGAAAYQSALRTDEQERKTFEATLAGSLQIVASPQARSQLVDGQVDARLGILIEGMASELPQPVHITEFGSLGPRASAGIPLRSATLVGSVATLRSTLAFALSQPGSYHPAHAEITRLDGQHMLILEFAAPSPLGLFNPTVP
jgi:hypothetical protein